MLLALVQVSPAKVCDFNLSYNPHFEDRVNFDKAVRCWDGETTGEEGEREGEDGKGRMEER